MELRNLMTFLRVAALQNFTRAADELGYSQSNVSAQIKQLEQELGCLLFDRIGKSVYLTSYGEALVPYARRVASSMMELESFMRSEESLDGTIRVGMTDSLFELLLEDAMLNYHRRFPRVRLELLLDSTTSLEDALRHGRLDTACLIGDPLPQTEWNIWDSVEIPIVLVANSSHPLASRRSITLADIAGQELILMEESAPYSRRLESALSARRLECRPFLRLQSANAARKLVEREPFVSLLPLYSVQAAVRDGSIVCLDVPEWRSTQHVQMVLHRSKVVTPQIQGFLEELCFVLGDALAERLNAPPSGYSSDTAP